MRAFPDGYAETPEGLLLIADGVSPIVRWDGVSASTLPVGVTPPATACALAKNASAADPGPARPDTPCTIAKDGSVTIAGDSGTATPITGTLYAFVRYMNEDGIFSTLSAISNTLVLETSDAAFGLIYENVPVPPPGIIRRQILRNADGDPDVYYVDVDTSDVTSTVFTSVRRDADLIFEPAVDAIAADTTPGIVGTYNAYVRFVNELGAVSDLSPISADLILTETDYAYGIRYTAVPVPTQSNVVGRQILRNTAGQADVYYVDIDTDDLVSTTFDSAKFDTELSDGEPVVLFAPDGTALANSHGVPPAHKVALAAHLGRMFAAVDRNDSRGGAVVTNGSTTVTGLNTYWTDSYAGRFLWVEGAARYYEILSVDEAAQTITLTEAYEDDDDPYASYTVRPPSAQRRLVYYSQAGEPESWPAVNAVEIPEAGDELTGLMVKGSFVYILGERHLHRYTFQGDPATDGFVFLSATRGCVNNRSWVQAEGTAFMLDLEGVHAFDGAESKSVSGPIQSFFTGEKGGRSINWKAKDLFFAVRQPDTERIYWFVCLEGESAPRHALAFDYRLNRWWVEEYDRPLTAGCEATFDGRRRTFFGGPAKTVYVGHQSPLEGIDHTTGDTRGRVDSAAPFLLVDPVATWPVGNSLIGNSITIVSGKGAGQTRTIVLVSGNTLKILTPWRILPDDTSVYQIGGIPWLWQSGWLRLTKTEDDEARKVEVLFERVRRAATLTLRVYADYQATPTLWRLRKSKNQSEGFSSTDGSADLLADMTAARGHAQQRMGGHKDLNVEGTRTISVEVSGVSSRDVQRVYEVSIDGVTV